jgi:hypothetical protein
MIFGEKIELKVFVNQHELRSQHMMPFEAGNVSSLNFFRLKFHAICSLIYSQYAIFSRLKNHCCGFLT